MDVLDLEGIDDDLELQTELQVEAMETGRSYPSREGADEKIWIDLCLGYLLCPIPWARVRMSYV
jgi:hypothetical protein